MVRMRLQRMGWMVALAAAFGLLFGCAGMPFGGGSVDPERRIPIPEAGAAEGAVDAGSAVVRYRIDAEPSSAAGVGRSLTVGARPEGLFYRVDSVRVDMAFLDAEGSPVSRHTVFATGFKTRGVVVDGRTFAVPAEARSIAFSVHAQASSGHR